MRKMICAVILSLAGAAAGHASGDAFNELSEAVPSSVRENPAVPAVDAAMPAAISKNISAAQLKDLLQDPNPEIRKAAVISAQNQIQNTYANDEVLQLFNNRNERADIRVEAARTLSYATSYPKVSDAFMALLRNGGEPRELRVMTYKALYSAAPRNNRYRDFLVNAVAEDETDRDARRAAIWALFDCSDNIWPQELLIQVINGNEEELTKIEAIKSLYGAVNIFKVKNLFKDMVSDPQVRKPLRLAALKALSGAADSSMERFIDEMIRNEQDPQMRAAAIEAASPNMADLREYFHLGYRLQSGGYISPIEKE